jgi:hypothetical protein
MAEHSDATVVVEAKDSARVGHMGKCEHAVASRYSLGAWDRAFVQREDSVFGA